MVRTFSKGLTGLLVGATALAAGTPMAVAGTLSTGRLSLYAGSSPSTQGFSGDDGPAVFAELNSPLGLATNAKGDLFVSDGGNGRVRRVDAASETITTVAGGGGIGMDKGDGGPATAAGLTPQRAVATDLAGSVFLLGELDGGGNTRVRVVDPGGTIRTFAGSDTPGFSGDGGPAAAALLTRPSALATDVQGDVFIAERARIRKVDTTGTISTIAGTGVVGFAGDGGPATAAQIATPQALATDAQGDLFISDGARIRRIDAAGTITTVAGTGEDAFGGDGGPATSARIGFAGGLAVGADGTVYLSDTEHGRVRAVDPSGRITTIAGTGKLPFNGSFGTARGVNLAFPQGLALDGHGDLFISDSGHQQVLELAPGPSAAAAGRCSYDSAVRYVEQHRLGNAGFTDFPVAQAFCGSFAGRHSKTMVVSVSVPSCGLSIGWLVLRRSGGHWKRVLKVRHGAFLTRSGARINEWQGVLAAGDAHCLPSSARVRTWHWNGKHLVHGRWHHRAKLPRHLPGTAPLEG